jgi:hypothetical protein
VRERIRVPLPAARMTAVSGWLKPLRRFCATSPMDGEGDFPRWVPELYGRLLGAPGGASDARLECDVAGFEHLQP